MLSSWHLVYCMNNTWLDSCICHCTWVIAWITLDFLHVLLWTLSLLHEWHLACCMYSSGHLVCCMNNIWHVACIYLDTWLIACNPFSFHTLTNRRSKFTLFIIQPLEIKSECFIRECLCFSILVLNHSNFFMQKLCSTDTLDWMCL